jgi:CheY-like chemotaxis protein
MSTFLIADDSHDKIFMLRGVLKAGGWTGDVIVAHPSEQAIQLIDSTKEIDAAFIDFYIPTHNGPAIIRCLREKFPNAHIALVTSAHNERNYQAATDAGADKTICSTDAWSEETLMKTVREWREERIG